ncbi:MAG: ABC transporter permease subunit [Pseudomonadota bacterium]
MSLTLTQEQFDLQKEAIDRTARKGRNRFIMAVVAVIAYLSFFMFSLPERVGNWGGIFERAYNVNQELSIDVFGALERMNPERAALYMLDTYAHKDHVTMRWSEQDKVEVSLEGSFQRVYDETNMPAWFSNDGTRRAIEFENGGVITILPDLVQMEWPGYDEVFEFALNADGKPYVVGYDGREDDLPDFMRRTENKVEVRPSLFERLQVGTSKVEVHRYKVGWEHFWFDFDSPLRDYSIWQGVGLAFSGERLTDSMTADQLDRVDLLPGESRSNAHLVFHEIKTNKLWGHGVVMWALLETVFMALLGTMLAAGVGLPLAFLAAKNIQSEVANRVGWGIMSVISVLILFGLGRVVLTSTEFTSGTAWSLVGVILFLPLTYIAIRSIFKGHPAKIIRFVTRRLFDLLRGIDTLIWSLIFLRAFGPGLFTGIFAIAFTDTGTLGKLMSEAVENADSKQREGVQSVGASKVQQHRFGILPQIMPVFISQSLYYLESNTRGAVIIGAMGAGGIGLQFLGALQTRNNFEVVAYLAILVLIVVILMDWMSAKLRRALIGGDYK